MITLKLPKEKRRLEEVSVRIRGPKVPKGRGDNFLDARRRWIKLWPVMVSSFSCLPPFTSKPCWNCHHQFSTPPLGCPTRYVEDGGDEVREFFERSNLPSGELDYFETEGLFCSWSCAKSFALTKNVREPHSHKYKESLSLLSFMSEKTSGSQAKIEEALPLESLEAYGGPLTIEEYRAKTLKLEKTPNAKRPFAFPATPLLREAR